MTFQLYEEDYIEMNESFERVMEVSERYEGLTISEIAGFREDEMNMKSYKEMMLASWNY